MSKWYQGTWNTENKNAWNEDWQEEPEEEYEGSAQMEDWLDDKDAGTWSTAILLAQIEHYYGKFQGNGSGLTGLKVPQELPAKSQASGQYTKENWTWQPKEIEREEGKFEGAAWAAHNLCEDNSYPCYTCGTKFPTASCLANMEGPDFKTFHKRATASDTLDQWTCRLNAVKARCAAAWARLPMWIAQQKEKNCEKVGVNGFPNDPQHEYVTICFNEEDEWFIKETKPKPPVGPPPPHLLAQVSQQKTPQKDNTSACTEVITVDTSTTTPPWKKRRAHDDWTPPWRKRENWHSWKCEAWRYEC